MRMLTKTMIAFFLLALLPLLPIKGHAQAPPAAGTDGQATDTDLPKDDTNTPLTPEEQLAESQKKNGTLTEKLAALEKKEFEKMLRPVKDIDFLYESVFGYSTVLIEKDKSCIKDLTGFTNATHFTLSRFYFWDYVHDTAGKEFMITIPMSCKLAAIESKLGTTGSNTEIIKRLDAAYKVLKYDQWKNDRLRFGLKAAQVDKLGGVTTGIILHAYPTYSRFMAGRLDLIRRTSFFASVGALVDGENDVETKGPIYSVGVGIDLARGFTITVGYSLFQIKEKGAMAFSQEESIEYGISLTSDLWKGLL